MYPAQTSFIPVSIALSRFLEQGNNIFSHYPYWYLGTTPYRYLTGPIIPVILVALHRVLPQLNLFEIFFLVLVFFGAYAKDNMFMDVITVLIFGALGYGMKAFGYNRPAFLLGFILGRLTEKYFFISLSAYGPLFFISSKICIIILVLIMMALLSDFLRNLYRRIRGNI